MSYTAKKVVAIVFAGLCYWCALAFMVAPGELEWWARAIAGGFLAVGGTVTLIVADYE